MVQSEGRKSPHRARREKELAARRHQVSELYLGGWSQVQLAEKFRVDVAQISRDLKALREQWRKENLATTGQHVEKELASLALDEQDARDMLDKCKGEEDEHKHASKWHEVLLKIRDRRSKLLGLDAPTKVESKVVATVDAPLPVELDADLERAVREAAARLYGPKQTVTSLEAPPPVTTGTNGTHA